jgi:hypothetical protein
VTPEQRAAATQVLHMNMVDYWYEVDVKGGAGVSEMYVEDGIFNGGGKPLVGRAAIEQFYSWRQDRGARTSRHVITIRSRRYAAAADGAADRDLRPCRSLREMR